MKADILFKITGWEEETVSEFNERGKLTRAHVGKSYSGKLEGEGRVEYLMLYRSDGTADYVGYESVKAVLNGKEGGFVFEHRGHFKEGKVDGTWTIVKESGTGALAGITGSVRFSEGHKEEYEITLDYEL